MMAGYLAEKILLGRFSLKQMQIWELSPVILVLEIIRRHQNTYNRFTEWGRQGFFLLNILSTILSQLLKCVGLKWKLHIFNTWNFCAGLYEYQLLVFIWFVGRLPLKSVAFYERHHSTAVTRPGFTLAVWSLALWVTSLCVSFSMSQRIKQLSVSWELNELVHHSQKFQEALGS